MPTDEQLGGIITPELVSSEKSIVPDRRLLILAIVVPYMLLCVALMVMILASELSQDRITLAASTILSPLGTIAGAIVAYYFKSS
jgi:hypothetical protein